MHVLVEGSGGAAGWPQPGCRCASCLTQDRTRARSTIVIDGLVRAGVGVGGRDGLVRVGVGVGGTGGGSAAGYVVRQVADARHQGEPGGWDVTGPDGGRLLYPARPGAVPVPPEEAAAYDIAFLDLLGEPGQLGLLRARGLITAGTVTAVAFADHRVSSEGELRRRCAFWRAELPGDGDAVRPVRSVEKRSDVSRRMPWRVLVLGGARSGKSEQAEMRLAGEPDVTYVATGPTVAKGAVDPGGSAETEGSVEAGESDGDPEWAARVAAHRARRPAWWRTVETTDLAGVLAGARGALLIDGIGSWLAAVMDECGAWDGSAASAARLAARVAGLAGAWRQTAAYVVAVSDETGLGVVPGTPAGRLFRDELGRLNQVLAAESEEAELVVAGRVIPLGTITVR
jgi:adenosylcobinamide kinase / adenosylcobinamide-phosphate guanylyltransferase